jgi:hypothetical protein
MQELLLGMIKLILEGVDQASLDPDALRSLCRREADRFDTYLRNYGDEYAEGLADWEKKAVEGYIYQKIRGRIDEQTEEVSDLPGGGKDGETTST